MGDQEKKTKEARIRRLKDRLQTLTTGPQAYGSIEVLVAITKGILDLLADDIDAEKRAKALTELAQLRAKALTELAQLRGEAPISHHDDPFWNDD